jgi:hypothetical protein
VGEAERRRVVEQRVAATQGYTRKETVDLFPGGLGNLICRPWRPGPRCHTYNLLAYARHVGKKAWCHEVRRRAAKPRHRGVGRRAKGLFHEIVLF